MDDGSYSYRAEKNAGINNRITSNINLSIAKDEIQPDTKIHLTAIFNKTKLEKVSFVLLSYKEENTTGSSEITIWLSKNAINMETMTMELPIGGLRANTQYLFKLLTFDFTCSGEIEATASWKTEPRMQETGKILLVIDQKYEGDLEVNEALAEYQLDVEKAGQNVLFETYYISAKEGEQGKLFAKIKSEYTNPVNPLRYIFFIGSNANSTVLRERYDYKTESLTFSTQNQSLAVYTQITAPEAKFDTIRNLFYNGYYDICAPKTEGPNGTTPIVFQSNNFDISFGALVPTRQEESKSYLLNYFKKLHQYKAGELTFEKKVLLADTFFNDGSLPEIIENTIGRWKNNDTIQVPQKFGGEYHGNDPIWRNDYLKKLNNNSYEVMSYQGHGSPLLHYYGIYQNDVSALHGLNTLLLDFSSCSIGDVSYRDYLAGTYLKTGNTLVVSAYSSVIGIASYNFTSPFMHLLYDNGRPMELFSKGISVSDAYRFGYLSNISHYILGDPLLTVDPPCAFKNALSITPSGSLDICPNETLILTASPNFSEYNWYRNGELLSRGTDTLHVTNDGDYTVSAKRCDVLVSNEQVLKVNRKVTTEPLTLELETLPTNFLLHAKPSGVYDNFKWHFENIILTETQTDTITPYFLGEYKVETNVNGCILKSNSVLVSIPQGKLKVIGQNTGCEGDSVSVELTSGYTAYHWYIEGQGGYINHESKQVFKKNTIVSGALMRGKLTGSFSSMDTITFLPKPPKPTVSLISSGLQSSSAINNQWFNNGKIIPGESQEILQNPIGGNYFVRVIKNGCYTDSDPVVITGIEPSTKTAIYPNPSTGVFWLNIPQGLQNVQLEIFDLKGNSVYTKLFENGSNLKQGVYTKLSAGLYLVRLQTGDWKQKFKLLISP